MNELFSLRDKVVVLTGACGVLGHTIVRYFAGQGARVVLLDLERASGTGYALADELTAGGAQAAFFPTDVLDGAVLEQNAREISARFGGIDVLLNAAGGNMGPANVGPDQTLLDLDLAAMRRVIDLNIMGTVTPTKIFLPLMLFRQKGSIINFCSMSSFRPLTRVAGYGIAKAGMASWTQWLAAELAAKYGDAFRVNAIAPGFLLTNQNRDLLTHPDGSLTDRSHKILAHTPFGRFLEPDELVGALHYLACDASRGVTGTVLPVDGGFQAFSI